MDAFVQTVHKSVQSIMSYPNGVTMWSCSSKITRNCNNMHLAANQHQQRKLAFKSLKTKLFSFYISDIDKIAICQLHFKKYQIFIRFNSLDPRSYLMARRKMKQQLDGCNQRCLLENFSGVVNLKTKINLHLSGCMVLCAILIYVCENWPMKVEDIRELLVFYNFCP